MKPRILKAVLLGISQGDRNWPILVFGTWTFSLLALLSLSSKSASVNGSNRSWPNGKPIWKRSSTPP